MTKLITLAAAFELHHQSSAGLGSYESYRKDAQAYGHLSIGGTKIQAEKRSGRWMVDAETFAAGVAAAVAETNATKRAMQQAEADYKARKLNPQGARLSWGSYYVSGAFHFVTTDHGRMRMRSNGGWLCNACWQPARTENNRPECHTCSDWNGCGTDCTLSRVFCITCGTSIER